MENLFLSPMLSISFVRNENRDNDVQYSLKITFFFLLVRLQKKMKWQKNLEAEEKSFGCSIPFFPFFFLLLSAYSYFSCLQRINFFQELFLLFQCFLEENKLSPSIFNNEESNLSDLYCTSFNFCFSFLPPQKISSLLVSFFQFPVDFLGFYVWPRHSKWHVIRDLF